jgi:hypothetical protein
LQGVYTFLGSQRCDNLFPGQPQIQTKDYDMCPETEEMKQEKEETPSDTLSTQVTLTESGDKSIIEEISPLETNNNASHFHEAGWDALCSGFVFLRLAYIEAYMQHQTKESELKKHEKGEEKEKEPEINTLPHFTWTSLLQSVKEHENKIHITMGQISHMVSK